MPTIIHADDYGITASQARSIAALTDCVNGVQPLNSVSIMVNSPDFPEAVALIEDKVDAKDVLMALHLDLVEGPCCADPDDVALLVDDRGMFKNDFTALLALSMGPHRRALKRQIAREVRAQLTRYFVAFPQMRHALRLDSHQHTHAIPAVFQSMLVAADACGVVFKHIRTPIEPITPHMRAAESRDAAISIPPVNLVKAELLSTLWRKNRRAMPSGCRTSLFTGVLLSGCMERTDAALLQTFEALAAERGQDLEVLFHPVSVPVDECLDPANEPFAQACAAAGRDREAEAILRLAATR